MQRKFRNNYIIRFDECDMFRNLTPAAALRFMQDIAGRDSEAANPGDSGYWVAKRNVLDFQRPITPRTKLQLETYVISFSKVTALRAYDFWVEGEDTPRLKARTLWVYFDPRGRPGRIPAAVSQIWLPDGSPPMPTEAEWPTFPEQAEAVYPASVHFSDLDVLLHMNNAAYTELLDNAAWEGLTAFGLQPDNTLLAVRHYDIEYVESALPGDKLTVRTWFITNPAENNQFERLQQIWRDQTLLARARSVWSKA